MARVLVQPIANGSAPGARTAACGEASRSTRVGVLALQGAFAAHLRALERLGHQAVELRTARDVDAVDGIVLPGGESSVMLDLLARDPALERALRARIDEGAPLLATCAGLILSAREVRSPAQRSFALLDVVVRRNAYGRQLDSTTARDDLDRLPLVLIRAPKIEAAGPRVEILATYQGAPVLVREGARVGATFHPELTDDLSVHALAFDAPASGIRVAVVSERDAEVAARS